MKKLLALLLTAILAVGMLAGCGSSDKNKTEDKQKTEKTEESVSVRVGSLKGPTTIGLVSLMEKAENKESEGTYTFQMEAGAEALLAAMTKGEMDIALIPANAASIWYNKLDGAVKVIDINTLGVLYMVSTDENINNMQALKGKTIVLTGKGTTPDYTLQYLLKANGMSTEDVTLEYKSEAAEVVSALAQGTADIGLLPQPFVTAACAQNNNLKVVMDMTEEWNHVQGEDGGQLVTGVTVVRTDFLEKHQKEVETFLKEHQESAAYANEHVKEAAELVEKQGIIEKAAIAEKAIPKCNITYIDGAEMKKGISGYLKVLYDLDPAMVGGNMPDDAFYYETE